MTTPQSTNWRRWLIGGVVLALVACIALGIIGVRLMNSFELGRTVEDQLSRADIERLIEAKLPASTSELHSYYTKFQDYYAEVRFDFEPAELPTLLASSAYTQTLATVDNPFSPQESDRSWWRPYQAQRFQWGELAHNGEYHTLLIDMTDPQRYRLYWRGFST